MSESSATETQELIIEQVGGLGEGVAQLEGRRVFIPLTLPGERVRARVEGERGLHGHPAPAEVVLERALGEPGRGREAPA